MRSQRLLIFIALAGIVSMSSCIKSYTCHCDIKYTGAPGLPDSTFKEYEVKDLKSGAESKCKDESGLYENNGIKAVETCYLY